VTTTTTYNLVPYVGLGTVQLLAHVWGVMTLRDNAREKFGEEWRHASFPGKFTAKHPVFSLLLPFVSPVSQLRGAAHFKDKTLYVSGFAGMASSVLSGIGAVRVYKSAKSTSESAGGMLPAANFDPKCTNVKGPTKVCPQGSKTLLR
jgi:hypothetical protein